MKISEAIEALNKVLKESGDLPILVDTEAGTFPYHMIDIENIHAEDMAGDGSEKFCVVYLDDEVMQQVHPLPDKSEEHNGR